MNIYTGSYNNCKHDNLISISGDKGKSIGYNGVSYTKLAPKLSFWREWHNNIGVLSDDENNKFYINTFYTEVLSKLDAKEVYDELSSYGDDIILLCYEDSNLFCHRYLVAAWLEYELGIKVDEVNVIDNKISISLCSNKIKEDFKIIIEEYKNICNDNVLGYDCDNNEIEEFRVLRFPFSADIENWDEECDVDPRFYCLVRSSNGEVYGISVYDDWFSNYIRRYEQLDDKDYVPPLIKSVSEMSYYEVAFSGITGLPWYYDRDRDMLRKQLDDILLNNKKLVRKK